jgi:hypothetical protein
MRPNLNATPRIVDASSPSLSQVWALEAKRRVLANTAKTKRPRDSYLTGSCINKNVLSLRTDNGAPTRIRTQNLLIRRKQ